MTLPALANFRCQARSVNCRDQAGHSRTADGVPRVPTWERRRPRPPNTLHCEEYQVAPVGRGSVEAQAWEVSPACNEGNPAGEGAGAPRDANGPGTTTYTRSHALRSAGRNRPRASGMCPGSMELTPGRDKEGDIASPVVFTLPRHGPGECRSAHLRSLPRHRSR